MLCMILYVLMCDHVVSLCLYVFQCARTGVEFHFQCARTAFGNFGLFFVFCLISLTFLFMGICFNISVGLVGVFFN